MQPKEICDNCGKEIESYGEHLWGSKWSLFGLLDKKLDCDFCSIKCLKEFVEKL